MPRLIAPAAGESRPTIASPIEQIARRQAPGLHLDHESFGGEWADVTAYKNGKPVAVMLNSILLRFDHVEADEISYSDYLHGRGHPQGEFVHALANDAVAWFERVASWTSALCNQDTETEPLRLAHAEGQGFTPWTLDSKGMRSLAGLDQRIHISMLECDVLSRSQWERVLTHANSAVDVPIAHQLLTQARADFRRGRYRRAVIDAGTAAEVVMNEMLRHELRRLARAQKEGLLREQRTLGRLYTTLRRIRTLPHDLENKLISVRNAAVHQNVTPDRATTQAAIDAAQLVVAELYPLN